MRVSITALRPLAVVLLSTCAVQAQQYSPQTQINLSNVGNLEQAWIYRTGDPLTPVGQSDPPILEATPVYADGVLYIGTPLGRVIALDALTGEARWEFDTRIERDANYGDFTSRGVTLWLDPGRGEGDACRRTVFFASIDARLFAFDATSGRPCRAFAGGAPIDLVEGLRLGPRYTGEYEQTSPPAVIDGLVVVGGAVADNFRSDAPSGEVRAFDARSGELRWTFDPLAELPDTGGANAWSRITTDEEHHLVLVPFGSPSPDYYGGERPGDNGYANSVVALDTRSGEPVWSFQVVHHDLWDYDVAAPPALFTVNDTPGVAVGSKSGHVFLLHGLTGEPLFPVEERAVPASDVPGEVASTTQPVPSVPRALSRQRLTVEDAWGATEADRASCREQIAGLRNEGVFTPPSGGSLLIPGNIGGVHWGGFAADSARGLLFVPVNNLASVARLVPRAGFDEWRRTHGGWESTAQLGTPYGMSRTFLLSPGGLPCTPPPFGTLAAIDVATGEIRWQVAFGVFPGGEPEWGSINLGGPLATAGGVVFIGASLDPAIRAFDAETGEEIWKAALPASARATPMSFEGSDGRQYVVIAAGGHDPSLGPMDNAVVAFALPRP